MGKGECLFTSGEKVRIQNGSDTMDISVEIAQKIKINLLYNPAITLMSIYLKKSIFCSKDTYSSLLLVSPATVSRN